MAKRRLNAQNQVPTSSTKRRKADAHSRKGTLSPLESLERDFIEIGEMDVDKLVLAAKSIFDSARRCLKGGKKRRVIQSDNKEIENAGVGWKVNFRTIMKHIREKTSQQDKDLKVDPKSHKSLPLKSEIDKSILSEDIRDKCSSSDKSDEQESTVKLVRQEKPCLKSMNESTMRKIWDCLSYSRCFPLNEDEMIELQDLEVNKYVHYSLPKNEWYFGKFWFNKSREDIIAELQNRRKGRYSGLVPPIKTIVATRAREDDLKRESLAVLTELKMQIMHSKIQSGKL